MLKISAALAALGLALLIASALPAGATPAPTPATSGADYGRALFVAKGCVACHHHAAIARSGQFGEGVPDLSSYQGEAAFLRRWLADPQAARPGTSMPTLGLSDAEVAALSAFLLGGAR